MEREVTTEIRMEDGIMLMTVGIGWIDGLHTKIESQDEVAKIQTKPQSISHSYLLIELRELKLSARLFLIIAKRPDVASVNKDSTIKLPKK